MSIIIDNVAFCIPIHPPKYQYIYDLILKLENNNILIDIFLIFSSEFDYNAFIFKEKIKPLIVYEELNINSIITFKKFFGLKKLSSSKYDYLICCDSEIDIIPNNFTYDNINEKIKNIYTNKNIYAGNTTCPVCCHINKTSANLFPNDFLKIQNITDNFNLYFWWSDLPVYKKSHIDDFFNSIASYDNIIYYHFDYIIYQYYLILNHDFKIVNTTPITNINFSLELLNTQDENILNKLLDINYGFSWNSKLICDTNLKFIKTHGGVIIYHLDRYK